MSIDKCLDTGRFEDVHFGPAFWSESGLPGVPAKGGPHEAWMLAQGTALRFRRIDLECGAFSSFAGYRIGCETLAAQRDRLHAPWQLGGSYGVFYKCSFSHCAVALLAEDLRVMGPSFTECEFDGNRKRRGYLIPSQVNAPIPLVRSPRKNRGGRFGRRSGQHGLVQEHCRFLGEVVCKRGYLSLCGCSLVAAGDHIALGKGVSAATIAGCQFNGRLE